MSSATEIDQIKSDLIKLGSELSPSELHGTLCGALCGRGDMNLYEWLTLTFFREDNDTSKAVKARELLLEAIADSFKAFFLKTLKALSDNNLTFYPLLPEDDSETIRLTAIAEWAQGFLMGLSLAGIKNLSAYPAEVKEFVETMASIATVDEYELAGDDSDEEAIIEFVEFIRIGVLLVNEEINPLRVPVDLSDTDTALH